MAITKTTDLDGLIQIIYEAARETSVVTPVMRNVVTDYDIRSKPGNTLYVPKFGVLTAEAVAEGEDYNNPQTMGTSKITAVAAKAKTQVILTDEDADDQNEDLMKRFGREAGRALAKKDDQDALALFSGFSAGISKANSAMTVGFFGAAQTQLSAVPVPSMGAGDLVCVLHPYQLHALKMSLVNNSTYGSNLSLAPAEGEIAKRFQAKELWGVNIFEDGNISVDSNSDAYGAMFHKEALGRLTKKPLWIEHERNASQDAWELNAGMRYKYFEVEDTFGRYILCDATAPDGS